MIGFIRGKIAIHKPSEQESISSESEECNLNQYFQTAHLKTDLKGRSVRGGAVTIGAQGARFLLNLASIMVLARLLAPEDFGLVAMVVMVSGFVTLFKDMGLSMATVQRAEITHAQVSTLFWCNVVIGLVLGVLLVCLAVPIAWFFGEPQLVAITSVLAMGIPIGGLSVQHQALLRRQMRFVALALIDIVATLVGIVIAISLAMLGTNYWPEANYWALVAMPLTIAAVGTIGAWVACRWRPSGPQRGAGVRPLLSFGGYLTGVNCLNYTMISLDKILIGRVWGAFPLGLYNQAFRLMLLPLQQINAPLTAIAIPVLSRLIDLPDRFRNYFRQGIFLVVAVTMPIVAFLFVAADDLVLLALGPQWTDSAVIFRALAPAGFFWTLYVAEQWVYLSTGRTDRQFRAAFVGTVLTTIAFVVGVQWGAIGVAFAMSFVQIAMRFPMLAYCFRGTPVRLADLGAAIWRPASASIAAGLITTGVEYVLPATSFIVANLIVNFSVFTVSYLLVGMLLPGGLVALSEVRGHLRAIRTR